MEDDLSLCVRRGGFILPAWRSAGAGCEQLLRDFRNAALPGCSSGRAATAVGGKRREAAQSESISEQLAEQRAESDLASSGGDQMGSWEDRENVTSVRMVWQAGELWWAERKTEEMTSKRG